MEENKLDDLLNIALDAAIKAGHAIMKIYDNENFDIKYKGDNSPLTKADVESHQTIVKLLQKSNIPILSEEGKDIPYEIRKEWDKLWIVDPIDGTKEFIKRNDEFTVNIALVENCYPILGVIYAPAINQLYFANVQIGSYKYTGKLDKINLELIRKNSIKLPHSKKNNEYTIVASRSHMSKETEDYINDCKKKYSNVSLISKGSSLKLCMVAEGLADSYPRFAPTMEWDTAAGQAICKFSGREVIDYKTKKVMKYNRKNLLNNWFLIS